eukprot:553032_1
MNTVNRNISTTNTVHVPNNHMNASEDRMAVMAPLARIYQRLCSESQNDDAAFEESIQSSSPRDQFMFRMHRLAQQVHTAHKTYSVSTPSASIHDEMYLPIGTYIRSSKTGKYYLNVGAESKSSLGFIYCGHEYTDQMIVNVMSAQNQRNTDPFKYFCELITLAIRPTLAIKYYGTPAHREEFEITASVYRNATANDNPLFRWLPKPSKNVIKLFEHCDEFMVTQFANYGDLLSFIVSYHNESANPNCYYISLVRFIFQQMVQSVHSTHSSGIAHGAISCDNFVLHFNETGQFLVKLIDFGKAIKAKKSAQTYDFTVQNRPRNKSWYTSPESALLLKSQDAEPYDAAKEDIYALGVVLFCLLTSRMPYNTPFYIAPDKENPQFGYLNANQNEKYQIDLKTMRFVQTGDAVQVDEIDPSFALLHERGVRQVLRHNCLSQYVPSDAADLLDQIFSNRMSMTQLIDHPFVMTPPDPHMLMPMIKRVSFGQTARYAKKQRHIQLVTEHVRMLFQNRIKIEAQRCQRIVMNTLGITRQPVAAAEYVSMSPSDTTTPGYMPSMPSPPEVRSNLSREDLNAHLLAYFRVDM